VFDDGVIFSRTDLGNQEVTDPDGKLPPRLRRCLVLVDGVRDVATLVPMFRAGELDEILEELHQGGYVEPDGEG
jgi:hypothetical protein